MTKNLVDFEVADFVDYIQVLANSRAIGGGEMSRLNYSDDVLIQNQINLEAADGRIIDADIALESTRLADIRYSHKLSMVAQANTLLAGALLSDNNPCIFLMAVGPANRAGLPEGRNLNLQYAKLQPITRITPAG